MKVREGYYSEQIRNDAFAHVDLNKKQFQVLEVIEKFQPISNEGIAKHLGVPMHTVTPRVLELRQKEVVDFVERVCRLQTDGLVYGELTKTFIN